MELQPRNSSHTNSETDTKPELRKLRQSREGCYRGKATETAEVNVEKTDDEGVLFVVYQCSFPLPIFNVAREPARPVSRWG